MSQTATKTLPAFVKRLSRVLRREFDAKVVAEPVNGTYRVRMSVISPRFAKMGVLDRQDAVWAVADRELERDEILQISLILTLAPSELH